MKETTCGTILMVVMLLVACSSESTPAASPPEPAPEAAAPPPPQAAPVSAADAQPTAAPAMSIASADSEQPGLRVEILELKRTEGGTVTLRLAFVNTAGRTQFNVGTLYQANLIDAVGKKKYFVAEDSAGTCLCSRNVSLDANARANLWAKFPAPPEDVQKITVVIPHFPPLEAVPISR